MRREYINYAPNIPIDIVNKSIRQYPIHWHNSIEIIFVLKGTLNITIETETYTVMENEIEIINCNEAHAIKSMDKCNEVLIFHLDEAFFERYYDDIKYMFFYTNSSEEGAQEAEKYYILRRYLSILLCEFVQRQEGYKKNIQNTLIELMFHLINNFHHLIYEEESLKQDEVQFERYDRIAKYIYSNYMNKISLQDIAKSEYLSSNYLSNKIKDTMGSGFNDILNLTRVEESIKLLLDTDKTISEISEEIGFSHIRYLNKHFKKYYKCTPMQYRKKYKVDDKRFEELKKFTTLDIKDALEMLSVYLEDYERYYYENRIIKVDVDICCLGQKFEKNFLNVLDVGDAKQLLYTKQREIIRDIQKNIGFKYCLVSRLFTKEMNIYEIYNDSFIDWSIIKDLLEFLLSLDMIPIIVIDESFEKIRFPLEFLKKFIEYFINTFREIKMQDWKFKFHEKLDITLKEEIKKFLYEYFDENIIFYDSMRYNNLINPIYDTCYMMPYIIENSISNTKNIEGIKAIDILNEDVYVDNELFFGGSGCTTIKGIKKPLYYAYYFLSMLGDEIIQRGEGYIISRKGEDIQILLYSYQDDIHELIDFKYINKKRGIKNTTQRSYSLNIFNLQQEYKIIRYDLNDKRGSCYNYWLNLGKPSRFTDEEINLINEASKPKISFGFVKKSIVYNIVSKVQGYGASLILLERVQKTS